MTSVRLSHVRIVCTDKGTHPSRELALMTLMDDPELLDELLAGAAEPGSDYTEAEARAQYAYDRVSIAGARASKRPGHNASVAPKRSALARDSISNSLYRFTCPTCRRDVPLRERTLTPILETLAHAGRVSLDISHLPPNLSSN